VIAPDLGLAPPRPPRERPVLDEAQRRVATRTRGEGHLLVVGAPGSGKTTTAIALFEHRLASAAAGDAVQEPVVLLVPGRRAAARVRDEISARLRRTVRGVRVRTPASFAYSVLRARAALLGEPAPTLVTGPEQDVVLAELLEGHHAGAGARPAWPRGLPPEALRLRGFRAELRDLLMRAAEAGLDATALAELGKAEGRAEWVAAAAVRREYEQVLRLGELTPDRGERFDAARVVDEAVRALRAWPEELPRTPAPRVGTVIVDDYQDATLATARLLRALADGGSEVVLFGDADVGVEGFRGGTPALVHAASADPRQPGGFRARRVVLPTVWRHGGRLREVTRTVTRQLGATGGAAHREAPGTEAARGGPAVAGGAAAAPDDPAGALPGGRAALPPSGAEVAVVRTRGDEVALVARVLREEHLHHGTAWSAMAVVVRGGAQAASLRRTLSAAGVPVAVEAGEYALRDAPAVRPLLLAAEVALTGRLTADAAAELLACPLAGGGRLDAVSLRALRRALRAEAIAVGDPRTADELLVDALGDPARCATLPAPVRAAPARVARVLSAARAAGAAGATAEEVLWAVWSAAGLAEPWRRVALAGGTAGDRADRDLDAVLALFRAAEQFTERSPAARPLEFLRHVAAQDIPADSLAPRGGRGEEVQVLTAAAAAGAEWDVVVVAGVQEDVWPDLRVRDSLLGAGDLVERAAGRHVGHGRDARQARRQVLQDELRAFAVAVSRPRRRLLVCAVRDGELAPSPFLDLVEPRGDHEDGEPRPLTDAGVPLDLRGLVARLRAELPDGPDAPTAAALLALLAARGVAGASPDTWWEARESSSDAPLWGEGGVALSPSSVGTAQRCALRWALERVGGRGPASAAQDLGTLVHEIAAALPHGGPDELAAELDRRWPELGVGGGWVGHRERRRAEAMVERLAGYLAGRPGPVEVEREVAADVAGVRVTGRADRLETASDGTVRVVDLKTGVSVPRADEVGTDPQLGAYQAAIRHGALGPGVAPGGGALVYLGVNKVATERHQPPLADGWAEEMLGDVARAVGGGAFTAAVGPACRGCAVASSCPARAEGRRVVG
jgi:superfamily I DNA/RNA helicase/RecB family exonuclease